MIPFIEEEIGRLLKSLMESFIKPNVMLSQRYMSDLIKIDVEDFQNHVPMNKVVIGFAANTALTKASTSEAKLAEFKYRSFLCYKSMVLKLETRTTSPCNSSLVIQLCCLNPQFMMNHPNSTVDKYECVLSSFIENKFVKPIECDDLLKQYKLLLRLLKLQHKESCLQHDFLNSVRIDSFMHGIIGNKDEYSKL